MNRSLFAWVSRPIFFLVWWAIIAVGVRSYFERHSSTSVRHRRRLLFNLLFGQPTLTAPPLLNVRGRSSRKIEPRNVALASSRAATKQNVDGALTLDREIGNKVAHALSRLFRAASLRDDPEPRPRILFADGIVHRADVPFIISPRRLFAERGHL